MELRVAQLEVRVQHMERDIGEIKSDLRALRERVDGIFRLNWAGIIATNVGLASVMAKGFGWL